MKHTIAILAILAGCGSAEGATQHPGTEPITYTGELVGNWCEADLCLRIDTTSYGDEWMVYRWKSEACQEGGFAQVEAPGQLSFGAFNYGPGCFGSNAGPTYEVTFSRDGNDLIAIVSNAGRVLRMNAN